MATAIDIRQLNKVYPASRRGHAPLLALDQVNLTIQEGEFFGLLGPNGAGKTTLIKTIVGLAKLSGGCIQVFGHDVTRDYLKAKSVIGLSPQEPNTDRYFTVRKVLDFQGGYYGMSRRARHARAEELVEQFGLASKMDTQYWRLSGGMQKRVMVARSLMTRPKILILDEPTAGVDVEQRHELWDHLKGLNRDGTTIILTTHYIDEAEILCERVGVIHYGKIVECGTPQQLIGKHCDRYFLVNGQKETSLNGFQVDQVEVKRGSLEEVFLKLTGQSIHKDERRQGDS